MKKTRGLTLALVVLTFLLAVPTTVDAGGPIGSRFVIYNAASVSEIEAAVAYNSQQGEYLVVWTAESAGPIQEIWGRRVARDGTLPGSAFRISPANHGHHPDVTYNSKANQYLVVWETAIGDICGQRVSATDSLLGSVIYIAGSYLDLNTQPAVDYAYTSDRYLVTFRHFINLGGPDGTANILARAYQSDGTPEDYNFEVAPHSDTTLPDQPDLAYNRSRDEFLVVWRQEYSSTNHDIWGRRVTMAGGASAHPDGAFAISTSTADETTPAVAAIATVPDAGQYLVAWESASDTLARTVAWDETLGTLHTLANTPWTEQFPDVAGCETCQQFLAVWVWVPVITPPAQMQVQARTLALDGSLLDSTTTVGGGQVFDTAVAAGMVGDFLIPFVDNEVFGTLNPGIYGFLWGNHVVLPLVMLNYQ